MGKATLDALEPRQTHTAPCERSMVAVALHNEGYNVAGPYMYVYVVNQVATSVFTNGTSGARGLNAISAYVYVRFAQLGCRVWFEWRPTHCNISDG